MEYLKEEELKEELKKSKILNKPTEKLKTMFLLIIENMLESSQFKNYDEETKDIMRIKAYEFLTFYWKNFSDKKIILYIKEDREKVKNILKINPKKIREVKNEELKISITPEEFKQIKEKLKEFSYKKEIFYPKAFAYFTQIVKSAFLQIIKKSMFSYIVKTDTNNEVNIIKTDNKEEKEYFNFNNSSTEEKLLKKEETLNKELILKKAEKILDKFLRINNHPKKDGCIEIEIINDIHPLIKCILEESENFDELILFLNFFYEEKKIKRRDITSNPTLFYILNKLKEQ